MREFGNFSAHPRADKSDKVTLSEDPARVLAEVTTEQAEYTIQVIERLFEDLYVAPRATAGMDALIRRIKGTNDKADLSG